MVVAQPGNAAGMRTLLAKGGYSFPLLLDHDGLLSKYGVRGYPTLVVLDQQGAVARTVVGRINFLRLSRLVDDLNGG